MKKTIGIILSLCILMTYAVSYADTSANNATIMYGDTQTSPYKAEIEELSSLGIISGYGDGTFRPEAPVTRAEAAKMFAVAKGYTGIPSDYSSASKKNNFSDFNSSHWAFRYACYLMPEFYIVNENGEEILAARVIDGFEDGTFRPEENITLSQFLKMSVTALNLLGQDAYGKEAAKNGGYPEGYVYVADTYGFSEGVNTDDIDAVVTREQAAKLISNAINTPLKLEVELKTISENHEFETRTEVMTFDGETNPHYPYKTIKEMHVTGDWKFTNMHDDSPIESAANETLYVYAEILDVQGSDVTANCATFLHGDGSTIDTSRHMTLDNGGFDIQKNGFYYFEIELKDNKWTVVNYVLELIEQPRVK